MLSFCALVRLRDSASHKRTLFQVRGHTDILQEPDARFLVDRRETHGQEFQLKKSRIAGTVLGAAVLLASSAGSANAQLKDGKWQLAPQPAGSRAVQAPPPPQTTVFAFPSSPTFNQPVFPRQPVMFTYIPAILMSDGSVFANFGFGYEPVRRSCGNQVVLSNQIQVVAGNGVVLSQGPTYTQSVPAQTTPSQQMVSSGHPTGTVSAAAQSSCFRRDASGRVFVIR